MTIRDRTIAAAAVAAIHLLAFGFVLGDPSGILDGAFQARAERILDGALPYADQAYEYPPLSLPLVLAPGLVSDSELAYREAFGWEMLAFDLAIVLLLALAVRGGRRHVWGALGVYTVCVIGISGIGPLPDSDLELAPLALVRFDLAPAALVLAAALAREASRSATWSALLSAGAAVKAFPLLLFPSFLRDEPNPRRVLAAALVPLALAAAIVLVTGDEFASAISYHSGRDLQVETLAANPFLIANGVTGATDVSTGAGAYNIVGDGVGTARVLSIVAFVIAYAWLVHEGWRRRIPPLRIATAILAVMIAFAPVLSPQFLLWVIPISAAAYGARLPNLLLVATALLTQVMLSQYSGVSALEPRFVIALTVRNVFLVAYVVTVVVLAIRPREPGSAPASPSPAPA